MPERTPPIVLAPSASPQDPAKSAAFIFVHGLGDDAEGVESIARQFQTAGKLPYMSWVLPNALHNHDVMSTGWYAPTGLSPFPPSRPELEDEEDEEGITSSAQYLVSLIDDLVSQGVPERRIVLGGFSQGHAMALFTGLTSSKYSGRLGGLVGLSGYLPLIERIPKLREAAGLPEKINHDVQVFIARGTKDMLVPRRYLTLCSNGLLDCGVKQEHLTVKEYDGMGHIMGGAELRDLCTWLETVVPQL
ncbi:acyl-protein thioesterase 1 [Paraphaeosphaeria sporulosa]|uniref:Acyl-protein thioesterase 1 n=1 Tax=Paraphaeosphaeria sporulosa TaxID=1460663 RepID=A0A177C755_9PLEO|nr:acyl-protein thioesterase 1 [Paraphaeosphaeria sporulosa]OAG02692.1 acyl-protein thioesterase 1 [Paraphaeosphaeria sporulosa]